MDRIGRGTLIVVMMIALGGLLRSIGHAQEITAIGVARSYSANYFMRSACPRFFAVNQSFAAEVGEGALMIGNDRFGAEVMKPLVVKELERRRIEVEATGVAAWCNYQRAAMTGNGLADLFR